MQQQFFFLCFSSVEMASKIVKPESLNDLSNEILMKIMFCLPIEELCTLTGVCKRFRLLACTVFKHYAKHMVFTNPIDRISQTTRIIKCFGQFIENVTLDGSIIWNLDQIILNLINQYCRSLKKLRLIRIHFDKFSIAIMKALVRKLNTIELLYCTIEKNQFRVTYNIALKEVENLKELVIIGGSTEIDLKFLNKKWPEMEKLEIIGPQVANQQMLAQFLKKNRSIKYFSYLPDNPTLAQQSWMRWFDNSICQNIQELSIELNQGIYYSILFESLTKLRRIVINCGGYKEPIHRFIDILSKIDTLEVLSLWHVKCDEIFTIPVIVGLKTFELREVKSVLNRKFLVDTISKRWNNVENLYLDHSIVYSADNMGIFIENMMQLKNLYLCDMRSFCLLPTPSQYHAWCSKRHRCPVQIFVDSRDFPPNETIVPNQPVVFRAFNNRISQMVNVICGSSLN